MSFARWRSKAIGLLLVAIQGAAKNYVSKLFAIFLPTAWNFNAKFHTLNACS